MVSAASSVLAAVWMAIALGRLGRPRWMTAVCAVALLATPLALRCATAVGSEAAALASASLAVMGLAAGCAPATGIGVGMGLGIRLSWSPLLLPLLLVSRPRRATLAWASGATLAWAVPLLVVVGPAHLISLYARHALGHATRWGGTALTEPARARYLLRDVFVDGMGVGADALGVALGLALAVAVVLALRAWRRAAWQGATPAALVLVPYLAWILLGQNLREQPRHALPLVAALTAALGVAALVDRSARIAALAVLALCGTRALADAAHRRGEPPAAAALVAHVRALPDARSVLVFGAASARFFEGTELQDRARTAESMGDVELSLARAAPPFSRLFVTDEIHDLELASRPLVPVAVFCRAERLDRRRPCLVLLDATGAR